MLQRFVKKNLFACFYGWLYGGFTLPPLRLKKNEVGEEANI